MIIYLNHLLFYSSTLQLIVLLVRYTWSICFRFISIDAINNQKSFILHFFFALFGFDFRFFSALNLLHPHIKTKSNACHQKTFHIVSLLKFIAVPAKSFTIFQFQCKFMLKNGDEKNTILCYPSKGSPIWRKLAILLGEKNIVHSFYYHRRVHRSSALLNLHIFFATLDFQQDTRIVIDTPDIYKLMLLSMFIRRIVYIFRLVSVWCGIFWRIW